MDGKEGNEGFEDDLSYRSIPQGLPRRRMHSTRDGEAVDFGRGQEERQNIASAMPASIMIMNDLGLPCPLCPFQTI